jgi:hypothetical protein
MFSSLRGGACDYPQVADPYWELCPWNIACSSRTREEHAHVKRQQQQPSFPDLVPLASPISQQAVIPLEFVRRDYFPHLTIDSLLRKTTSGELSLPIVRIEDSLKAAKGVHLSDLALYIDARVAAARKECAQLTGEKFPDGQ